MKKGNTASIYGLKMPHTEQINLTLFNFDLVPFASIYPNHPVQSPISGLSASCQYGLCWLSDHILLICHLPVCPLTPTESAIHTYSASKHCILFKLLRSSCHLTHWAPNTVLPVLLRPHVSVLPCSQFQVSWSLNQHWISFTKNFSYLGSQVLSTVKKWHTWALLVHWNSCCPTAFNPVRNILSN